MQYLLHLFTDLDLHEFFKIKIFGFSIKWIVTFVVKAGLIYLFIRILTALAKYFFRRSMRRDRKAILDDTKVGFVRHIVIAVIYVIGTTAILSLIPGMEKVSNSILASAGIVAMAVGLASQDALSNIVGGLFIVFSRPFRVGDYIQVDNMIVGTVMEITLRHTIIRNIENRMILIPNNKINSATIINSSYGEHATCSFVEVGVSYDTDLDRAIDVMRDEIMKHPLLIDHRSDADKKNGVPQVIIRVINLGDSAITLRAWAWAADTAKAFALKCDLLKAVKERFDREKIEIPYPYFNQIVKEG